MAAPIDFYFDFISPYAYLAWEPVQALAAAHGRELALHPVLFAGLLEHWGQLGPAEIPPKRSYTFKQVYRRAAARGLDLSPPPAHPFNPLLALRLASLELDRERRIALIDCLFRATWAGGPGVAELELVAELLRAAGFDAQALLEAATTPENKRRLIAEGQRAIEAEVFGVPTMIAEGELFWGEDSLGDLDRFLRGEDPLEGSSYARWAALPVGVQRGAARSRAPEPDAGS